MELLAPAGSLEKLKYAVAYGADSVYAAGKQFGLRAKAANLSDEDLLEAVTFCHQNGKKLFVPVNIFAHNRDLSGLIAHVKYLETINVDAIIVSDPGVVQIAHDNAPNLPIHLSTQANTTSWEAVRFWKKQGIQRIILARELSFAEVKEIKNKVPDIELEIFIHGAMCISYSGRCLISAFLNNRSANQGSCTHPCRWEFTLHESSRPKQYFPIEEDERGSYILNSKDLCLFNHLEEIINSGIEAIKIEGRMKSLYYVANVTRVYRTMIDLIEHGNICDKDRNYLRDELDKVSHREWTTGFFNDLDQESQCYRLSSYIREYQFLGELITVDKIDESILIEKRMDHQRLYALKINVRAKFSVNDRIEIVFPDYRDDTEFKVDRIFDNEYNPINETKPNTMVYLISPNLYPDWGIVRKVV